MNLNKQMRVAILSMYKNQESQGMHYLKSFLEEQASLYPITWKVFATRKSNEIPDPEDFDLFLSTGGPGDPHDGMNLPWEKNYFDLLDKIRENNEEGKKPKFVFSICHSFQLLCRWLNIADVVPRPASCFGIFPCMAEAAGLEDRLFGKLPQPFLVVENRSWQCVRPNEERMKALGIRILAKEMNPPGREAEPALLALRVSPWWLATQFHPETDPSEMKVIFSEEKKKLSVIGEHGSEKWVEIMDLLEQKNPSLAQTRDCLLPEFFRKASEEILA